MVDSFSLKDTGGYKRHKDKESKAVVLLADRFGGKKIHLIEGEMGREI